MYYYLRELKGYDVNIIGLDLKTDVIKMQQTCSRNMVMRNCISCRGTSRTMMGFEGGYGCDFHACDKAPIMHLPRQSSGGRGHPFRAVLSA